MLQVSCDSLSETATAAHLILASADTGKRNFIFDLYSSMCCGIKKHGKSGY